MNNLDIHIYDNIIQKRIYQLGQQTEEEMMRDEEAFSPHWSLVIEKGPSWFQQTSSFPCLLVVSMAPHPFADRPSFASHL